jgi:hypothetical protein
MGLLGTAGERAFNPAEKNLHSGLEACECIDF